jgi:hypothetical protein
MIEIRSGSKWLCLEDVKMNSWITYKKGKVYISENNFCITDENSNKEYRWIDEEKIRRYFKFYRRIKDLPREE